MTRYRHLVVFAAFAMLAAPVLGGPRLAAATEPMRVVRQIGSDPTEALAAAEQALADGRFGDAEQLYGEVVRAFPNDSSGYLGLAEALLRQNKRNAASAAATRAAALLLAHGQAREAVSIIDNAIALDPVAAQAHRVRGQALITNGQFSEASRAFTRAIAYGDKSIEVQLLLAGALWEAGELGSSEAAYRKAIRDSGAATVALHQLGTLLLWQGRYDEARRTLEQAARGSTSPDLELDLGRALEGSGDHDAALEAYDRAVTAAPDSRKAHYAYARLLARTGHTEESRAQMDVYQRLYQENQDRNREAKLTEARLERAWGLLQGGDPELAAEEFAALPPTLDALEGLAYARAATGDHAGAVQALEAAVPMAPERRDLQRMLAQERLAAGQQR